MAVQEETLKLCVILHCGYEQELDFYLPYLKNVSHPYDLYVTIPQNMAYAHDSIVRRLSVLGRPVVSIPMPNKGMDGGGWLAALHYLSLQKKEYDYVLKVHTKSPHHFGPWWRKALMDAVAADPKQVDTCLEILKQDRVGMVGCKEWIWKEVYRPEVDAFSKKLGLGPQASSKFVGGTIFWAKFPLLSEPFKGKDLMAIVESFPEGKPPGESEAHWMERLLGNLIVRAGKEIVGV